MKGERPNHYRPYYPLIITHPLERRFLHASDGARAHARSRCARVHPHAKSDTREKNNIIGEMYAVIIGIHKMIIHIKQSAQSQAHLHVLDYMHFKSNFRRAYE